MSRFSRGEDGKKKKEEKGRRLLPSVGQYTTQGYIYATWVIIQRVEGNKLYIRNLEEITPEIET